MGLPICLKGSMDFSTLLNWGLNKRITLLTTAGLGPWSGYLAQSCKECCFFTPLHGCKGALGLEAPLGLRCLRATVAVNVEHDSYSILTLFQAISLCRQSLITYVCVACYGSFVLELCLSEIHVRGKLFTVSL